MNFSEQEVLKLLPETRLEVYPCAMFLEEFTLSELELAVKEYLRIHNFAWSSYTYPQPKGRAKDLDFTQRDFPEDMSDAMSLEAFGSWLESKPLTEGSARTFCQTVCSIAKGMSEIYRYSKQPFEQIEDTFESALAIQYALYPKSGKLKS
ncbi:MAG: hypothetical protein QNJ38_17625 [Prochloraceae cyanobacterium]|nr:hypothetical protein [Prochloraceae cyanobacterium]